MSQCTNRTAIGHRQCAICLRRECQEGVGRVANYGQVFACGPCVRKAVSWAYQCATKWGGAYPEDSCGYKERKEGAA